MEYILVIVNLDTREFEIVGRADNNVKFAKEVERIYKKTRKEITGYTPDASKTSEARINRDWKDRGLIHSKGIYFKLREAAKLN